VATASRPRGSRPRQPAKRARRSNTAPVWIVIAGICALIVSLPTTVVFCVGMLPSLVAAIVDRTPEKRAAICVAGTNLSGVFPFLVPLWTGPHTLNAANEVLTNVFALSAMLGAAAFGWVLFICVPTVVTAVMTVMDQRRVEQLRATQRKLIGDWGEDIARQPSRGKEPKPKAPS